RGLLKGQFGLLAGWLGEIPGQRGLLKGQFGLLAGWLGEISGQLGALAHHRRDELPGFG
ncbi:MAG: hypothetical protein HN400_05690, partial [Nitrospinaceae bacterium]|nr:hypothetical protein [Nitrospinaceae bacterium]